MTYARQMRVGRPTDTSRAAADIGDTLTALISLRRMVHEDECRSQLLGIRIDHVERLNLRRCGHVPVLRQMGQKRPHLAGSHFTRVPLVVEQDEPLDPTDIRLLSAVRQAPHPAGIGHLVKEPRLASLGDIGS